MSKSSDSRTTTMINAQIKKLDNSGKISDGYHTFNELYDHRITLFMSLANLVQECLSLEYSDKPYRVKNVRSVWKSYLHNDLSKMDGWFVAGIDFNNYQITYHLPLEVWDHLEVTELACAPEFDGHTAEDVLERLKKEFV